MITKTKLNKVTKLAGSAAAHLDRVPDSIQKKLNAEQLAELCGIFAALVPEVQTRKARIDFAGFAKRARGWFTFDRVELPRLAIGVDSIRARLLSARIGGR